MKHKPLRRGLNIEGLEDRQMMAGNVTVAAANRILTITGDGADNGIAVVGIVSNNNGSVGTNHALIDQIQVIGFEKDGATTTVNTNHRLTFTGIRQIVVNMGSGDDALVVTNINLNVNPVAALSIQMGDGDDIVGLGRFDNKKIETILGVEFTTPLIDEVVDPLRGPLAVNGNVTINLGNGDNELRASAMSTSKNLSITSGTGEDIIRLEPHGVVGETGYIPGVSTGLASTISTGAGHDKVTIDGYTTRTLNLSGGSGNDDIKLRKVTVNQDSTINGNDDQDDIRLDGFTTSRLVLQAGAGDDNVSLKDVAVTYTSVLDGGTGDNLYRNLGGNSILSKLRPRNFVTVILS